MKKTTKKIKKDAPFSLKNKIKNTQNLQKSIKITKIASNLIRKKQKDAPFSRKNISNKIPYINSKISFFSHPKNGQKMHRFREGQFGASFF